MRQSVTLRKPDDYADASFPGLLETLIHADRHSSAESKGTLSAVRRQSPKPLPEAKARHVDEAATLSYEQALRRHSRRRPAGEPDLPGSPDEKHSAPGQQREAASKSSNQAAGSAKPLSLISSSRTKVERAATSPDQPPASPSQGKSMSPSQTQSWVQSRSRAETRKIPPRATKPKTSSQTPKLQEDFTTRPRASQERISKRAKPSSRRLRPESGPQPSPRPTTSSLSDKALELRRSLRENLQLDHQSTERSRTRSRASTDAQISPLVSRAIARHEQATLDPVKAQVSAQVSAQRRTILSLRLSEEESAQLKLRAAESGISVSAYMRSCVLDAEHLRAQVKQTLAEMRLSIRRSEPASTMQLSTQPGTAARGTWFGVITRTAALFLAPLLSMRHRS